MLEVKDIDCGYGTTQVLRQVSLQIAEGQVIALLGPNGAGKTTLLRCVAGLLSATSGKITWDGRDISRLAAYKISRLGAVYIPDNRGVFPSLTVKENFQVFGGKKSLDKTIDTADSLFPVLAKRLSQTAGTMSGGEQQMLALVRAAALGKRLAMIDEVSLGLAPRLVDELYVGLNTLANSGMSILLVEQYVQRALEVAGHVYLLSKGRVTYSGPPSDVSSAELMQNYVGVAT